MNIGERLKLGQRTWSYRLFFPAAALYAAATVPLSLAAMQAPGWLPALASPLGHARELLSGFALAVVSGYLLGSMPRARLWLVFLFWLSARAAWLIAPASLTAVLAQALFAAVFAGLVAPKFLGRGRKLRNLAVAPLIVVLATSAVAFDAAVLSRAIAATPVALATVLLLAWLMAFMGGRLIAPAAAGQRYRQGEELTARVQPRIEGGIIACLAAAAVLALLPRAWPAAGALALLAAALLAVRLGRWQLWRCHGRPDLWCLGAGYAWIVAGLALLGANLLDGRAPQASLHAITVGAVGTLTFNVMLRTHLQRAGAQMARNPVIPIGTALIAVAAIARIAAGPGLAGRPALLWAAAAAWSAAYLLLAAQLLYHGDRERAGPAPEQGASPQAR